jgi:hypothetical protein
MARLSLVLLLVPVLTLALAAEASACSCAPPSPRESFRESEAAIVARLVEVVPRPHYQADYVYRVRRVHKGGRGIEAGELLSVRSGRNGASCGMPRGERPYGIFLERFRSRWASSLCWTVSPRKMRRAARGDAARATSCTTGRA